MRINTMRDLRLEIASLAENLDPSQYKLPFEELIERVAGDFLATIRQDYNFSWGDEFPDMNERLFWVNFDPYLKD